MSSLSAFDASPIQYFQTALMGLTFTVVSMTATSLTGEPLWDVAAALGLLLSFIALASGWWRGLQ